jgi:NitT/TauT family transport system permease protein
VPKIALAPFFILIWGFNSVPNVVMAMLLSFFPILSNTSLGVKSVDRSKRELMAALGASRLARMLRLEFPEALPYLLTGMEVGVILALIGAVVGEYLNPNGGLGATIVQSLNTFQLDKLFAAIVLLTLLGQGFYVLIFAARRFFIPWHQSGQNQGVAHSRDGA